MMVQNLSNHKRRPTDGGRSGNAGRVDHGSDYEIGSTLKSMMSSLLPSLDASMDSHFSKDFSHSEMTTSTAGQNINGGSNRAGHGHADLGDSSEEDMTSSQRKYTGSSVKDSLKKAFNKMTKRKPIKGNNSRKRPSQSKKYYTAATNYERRSERRLELEEAPFDRKYDDVSVDSTVYADPPTVCSEAHVEPQQYADDDDPDREKRSSRSKGSSQKKKSASRRARSFESDLLDDCSESGRRQLRQSTKISRSDRPEPARAVSCRLRPESSGSGRKLPPKSKSCHSSYHPPPCLERSEPPRRDPSFASRDSKRRSSRGSHVAAAPIPRARRTPSGKHPPLTRRRTCDSSFYKGESISRTRSLQHVQDAEAPKSTVTSLQHGERDIDAKQSRRPSRAKSFDGATPVDDFQGSAQRRRSVSRSKEKPCQEGPDNQDFDGPVQRRRSISRSKEKRKSNSGLNSSSHHMVVCRHGEKLGECCYDQASVVAKVTAPLPLFSLENHFGAETCLDEVSIDTCDTEEVFKKSSLSAIVAGQSMLTTTTTKNNNLKAERRRSKSRSKSPNERPRSWSRSESQSRREVNRRPSDASARERTERSASRSRRPSASERQRSGSRSRRPSSAGGRELTERKRSKSRSRRPTSGAERGNPNRDRSRSTSRNSSSERDGARSSGSDWSLSGSRRPSVVRSSTATKKQEQRGRTTHASRRPSQAQPQSHSRSRQRSSSHSKRRPSGASHHGRSSSRSRQDSGGVGKTMKQYETLSKEDFGPPKEERGGGGRRPRSLSRTRRSSNSGKSLEGETLKKVKSKPRISRSLSRTPSESNEQPEGIGDYLKRSSPSVKPIAEEDANSQSTGSKTTGSSEITYLTPQWMWNNSSTAGSSFSSSLFSKSELSDFSQMKEASSSTNNISGSDRLSLFQQSVITSHSYDGSCERSTLRGAAPAAVARGSGAKILIKNGYSPPLGTNNLQKSISSCSTSSTPSMTAKHPHSKALKQG